MHNFKLVNADTDSISFCKEDMTKFTKDERVNLLKEINSMLPERIKFADDGYYETVVVLKSKNYVLKKKGEKPKYKGSAIKATLKEPRLKDFIKDVLKELGLKRNNYLEVYNLYVKEIMSLTSIDGYVTKKTITDKVKNSARTQEENIRDVIEGTEYKEADKIFVFYDADDNMCLKENFKGSYSKDRLLKKLYSTAKIFDTIINVKSTFLDYSLKRNKKALEELLGKL